MITSAPSELAGQTPPSLVSGALASCSNGGPGNARPAAGGGAVDIFLSLFAGMIAREELPPEREKSRPVLTVPAVPADCAVVSPLLLRGPQAQPARSLEPPVPRAGQGAGGAQNEADQLLAANSVRAARAIVDNAPAAAPVPIADAPAEVAFAVRLIDRSSEGAPPPQPVGTALPVPPMPGQLTATPPAQNVSSAAPSAERIPRGEKPLDENAVNEMPVHAGNEMFVKKDRLAPPPPAVSPAQTCDEGSSELQASAAVPPQARAKISSTGDPAPAVPDGGGSTQAPAPNFQHFTSAPTHTRPAEHIATSTAVRAPLTESASASPHAQPAKEISVRLAADDSPPVDIRLVDRAGSVRVAVRTADPHLARSMQAGLGELVKGLEHKGFAAEIWSPAGYAYGSQDADTPVRRQQFEQGSGAFEQFGSGHHQGQGENGKHDGRHQPQWVLELANSLGEQEKETRI